MPQKLENICMPCRGDLARLNILDFESNLIQQIFWGRVELIQATAFLFFEKNGKIQKLLHYLKYKSIKEIGTTLGEMAALELSSTPFFESIDLIIPVPIHKLKKQKRGYNQSNYIAKGISNITELLVDDTNAIKNLNTSSQTKKNRYERYKNVTNTFSILRKNDLKNKHILIVDDVVTTGATIEAFANELTKIEGVQLSLLTIAFTK